MSGQRKYAAWTAEENARLVALVAQNKKSGRIIWDAIAPEFPGRTVISLKSQFTNRLKTDPSVYHKWTDSDCALLKMCVQRYGHAWSRISKEYFPSVNPNALHSKYFLIQKQMETEQQLLRSLREQENLEAVKQNFKEADLEFAFYRMKVFKNRQAVLEGKKPEHQTDIDKRFGVDQISDLERGFLAQRQQVLSDVDLLIEKLKALVAPEKLEAYVPEDE